MKLIVLLMLLLAIPVATASHAYLPLLAVTETSQGLEGSNADLYMEVRRGVGRVFIDTFPLSKVDTQVSTRFAAEIACNLADVDCSSYDMFFVIRSESSIIGGPSASASVALLTVSELRRIELKEDFAMTGTINSGGVIGPVGGLKQKIEAASWIGLKRVLIPQGQRTLTENNETIDLAEFGKELGIDVIEVADLNEALFQASGVMLEEPPGEIIMDESYESIMRRLADSLCSKSEELESFLPALMNESQERLERAMNLTAKAEESEAIGDFYSAASYCFAGNVLLRTLVLEDKNLDNATLAKRIKVTEEDIESMRAELDSMTLKSVVDLQTYLIVEERINDAQESIDQANDGNLSIGTRIHDVAYATERLNSARSWSYFFGSSDKQAKIDKAELRRSCLEKLAEAEERYQYTRLFIPRELDSIREGIDNAYERFSNSSYESCIFQASKAKAESNVLISVMGIDDDQLRTLLSQKQEAARRQIAKHAKEGLFPIMGYSYYEYSRSLSESDPVSAIIYAEYALEMSNLDMYFKEPKRSFALMIDESLVWVFLSGVTTGILAGFFLFRKRY